MYVKKDKSGKASKEEPKTSLDELMEHADAEETFFVGASTGYIFIGTVATYKEDIEKISSRCVKALNNEAKLINNEINEVNKLLLLENDEQAGVEYPAIRYKLRQITKGLQKRKVIETYQKILEDEEAGTAVIIRGLEGGRFWFKKEYDASKKRRQMIGEEGDDGE